ncbi:MAG: 50S ribosomal protein L31e [Candidatus Methanofastidiosa archaeon]|jgi:large subunit ribosomal protein L31e|nr:50S ribosomal protein L31e [Candidatus Methanofastidiosa archaeon]HOM96496.1 50S ribosomal protein L31e [Methanofastidiosum sp.]HRS25267.1 50S ribosomal protein L31e [Methanofastidiosum sp.]
MENNEERMYVVPLRKVKEAPRNERAARATRVLREFVIKHSKCENVKIDKSLNEKLWENGIQSSPSKIKIRIVKGEEGEEEKRDVITAYLAE